MQAKTLLLLLFTGGQLSLVAQAPQGPNTEKNIIQTRKSDKGDFTFDGVLNDPAWETVGWSKDFTQYQPDQGKAPSQQTRFKVIYDDKYLILGFRCFDSAPDSIARRMSRRDEFPGDWIEVNIDSYHDLRTAFSFTFSVSGVRGDEFISGNGNKWDSSWNPIWSGKSNIDSLGWTAEVRIPFSQLRYGNQAEPVWGIQVQRLIFRKEERSTWQYIPQNAGAWVSEFGELHGLRDLPSYKQIELAPYALAQTERFEKEAGNPFADGSRNTLKAGLDGKIGITRDLILDFTVNPDFGQVEADPGAVRLDGYEVFFQERRPFFVESRNLFDFQLTGSQAGGNYDSDILFYSRRIGGAPHGDVPLQSGEYADIPQRTSILGASKFSGKTKDGLSIGILESVSRREMARIDSSGERRELLVEPLTNYFVGRLLKDYDQGNTIIGGVFTAVNREGGIENLHRYAYSGGLDFQHYWKKRWWYMIGNLIVSRVGGTAEAISQTQNSFVHLFQRPNARHVEFDPARTTLTGTGGTFRIGKVGGTLDSLGGVFKFESGATWRSPELELNDIGYLQAADEVNHFTWAGYHIQRPFSIFRNLRMNYNHFTKWDFGGRFLFVNFNMNVHANFQNQWQVGMGGNYNPYDISNNALRGGSPLRRPPGANTWFYLNTARRNRLSFSANGSFSWGFDHTIRSQYLEAGVNLQPIDAMSIGLYPSYGRDWRKQDQFVTKVSYEGNSRVIVSEVEQRNFALTTRLSYNVTPDLTLQYYGQPFIFRAKYKNFAYVQDPMNKTYAARFHAFNGDEIREQGGRFDIDENRDGETDYSFGKPDFNFIQFRSNLVVRWEYIPGSELYFVWSQGIIPNAYNDLDTPIVQSLFSNIFDQKQQNIWLVKMTYRLLR